MHRKVKYVPDAGKLLPHEPEKVHAFRGRSVGHVTRCHREGTVAQTNTADISKCL